MKTKEEIKLEFFKKFDNESFRGYPLEQCNSIWDFFEKHIQCQQDMAEKKYTEEDLMSAFNAGINNDYGNGPSFDKWLNSLNKQD